LELASQLARWTKSFPVVAQYYFHINGEPDFDEAGQEFSDDEAARLTALRAFGEILRDERVLLGSGSFSLSVTDAEGRSVVALAARDETRG